VRKFAARSQQTCRPRGYDRADPAPVIKVRSFSGTGIWFTGHGYNGQIGALSSFRIPGISLGGNTVEITLTPQ